MPGRGRFGAATEATVSAADTSSLKRSVTSDAGQGYEDSPTCVQKHAAIVIGARRRTVTSALAALLLAVLFGITWLVVDEVQTLRRQAAWLSGVTGDLHYAVEPGASTQIRIPGAGPFDERLGYHQLPERVERLAGQVFGVAAQARMSPRTIELIDEGLFAACREKTQARLELRDCRGQSLARPRFPERTYERFDSAPTLLTDSLLFIENRELLDPRFPMRNPAIARRHRDVHLGDRDGPSLCFGDASRTHRTGDVGSTGRS